MCYRGIVFGKTARIGKRDHVRSGSGPYSRIATLAYGSGYDVTETLIFHYDDHHRAERSIARDRNIGY